MYVLRQQSDATDEAVPCRNLSCPTVDVIRGISGKWTPFILMALAERPHRFGQLRRILEGVSQRMLTQTLRDLQRDGYITRTVIPTKPPSVEYTLSHLGESLYERMASVLDWARSNHGSVQSARRMFDRGEQVKLR